MKKVLLIGPIPEPTTGVSLANKVIIENIEISGNFKIEYINTAYPKFEEIHGSFSFKKIYFFIKVNFLAYKVFRNDIIYITPGQTFFGVLKYLIFILISKLFKKELILHIHGNYLDKQYELLKGIKKKIFFKILNLTNKGIVLSKSLIGNLTPFLHAEHIYILNNFVEDNLIDYSINPSQKKDTKILNIIYVSNLMKEKGIFDLLDAFILMNKRGIAFKAKIAGNIDENSRELLNEYLSKLKNVDYCGVVKGKEKLDLYNWGNIFILPTYYKMEGQPIAILEAMATGNVILTTKHAGISDVFIDGENGYYVDKGSPLSIVEKVLLISSSFDNNGTISIKNKNLAKNKFTVHNFIKNLENIFNS
ncbi:glycosyltransferase family 4 protein [Confluentibacter lentus]|uniref:glycosyltransferase family 4 protein n=1 Tax=Confluentibacter lentus TaxID=1699412 RepID=UPI000C29058B|nr:glycosyltransferase family 4 protein [Confluentibacter lentus]